jgi:hypothetical protein
MVYVFVLSPEQFCKYQNYSRERTNTYHDIYKTIQGIEATHTTIFTKLFRGEKQHLPHYLQNHSGERPSTYHDIYKAIHEREPTFCRYCSMC